MDSFGDSDTNPFEDPSVKHLTSQPNVRQGNLEEYNPFENNRTGNKQTAGTDLPPKLPAPSSNVSSQTAPMSQPSDPPPAYTPTSAQNADLLRRQEELERRAAELQARETRLEDREARSNVVQKNWPPLPKRCCVGPCFYQDITIEIPLSFQKTVRTMYYMWIFYIFLLFLNMIGTLALFISNADGGTTFGVSLLILFLFTPLSFVCWFRTLYKAFRNDSSFNFMVFFFVFFFQFIVAVFYAVGVPHMGSCGLLNGITTLSADTKDSAVSKYTVGIIAVFIGFLWAIDAAASLFMLIKIHRMYRSTGASFAKAQEELASGVMRNEHVQSAAANVVSSGVQQAMNTGVRY